MQKSSIADNQQGNALSYLCGVFVGDGCFLAKKDIFHVKSIDEDFIDHIIHQFKILKKDVGYNKTLQNQHKNAFGTKPIWHLDIRCVSEIENFNQITHQKREIPIIAYKFSKSFIEGILDSDGWFTINVCKGVVRASCGMAKCNDIYFDIIKMLHRMGIKTHKMRTRKLKSGKLLKEIRFNVHSFLDSGLMFHLKRKQDRVERYREILGIARPSTTIMHGQNEKWVEQEFEYSEKPDCHGIVCSA